MPQKNLSALALAESDPELERAILFLQDPLGDEPHQTVHLQAAQYLLDHSANAHPRLIALLQSNRATNPYAVIEILPRFALSESLPILEQLMVYGPKNLSQAAAQALATHPLKSAREALLRGLNLSDQETIISAADGLMTRGDPSACSGLQKVLTHSDPAVRYHVIQAAGSLGCLKREALSAVARDDLSEGIRELANKLLKATPNQGTKP